MFWAVPCPCNGNPGGYACTEHFFLHVITPKLKQIQINVALLDCSYVEFSDSMFPNGMLQWRVEQPQGEFG